KQALAGDPITVTGDGHQTRSVCYVTDTVEGLLALADSDVIRPVNIGSEEEVSVLDLAHLVRDFSKSASEIVFVDRPEDDPYYRRPAITVRRSDSAGLLPSVWRKGCGAPSPTTWTSTHPGGRACRPPQGSRRRETAMPDTTRSPVSVVVATRDRVGELRRTLNRLGSLEPRPPVVVVDNASEDETAETVRTEFPDVTLVRLGRNIGCAARNTGVAYTNTPYVAFSDDDSWWAPGALERAADAFDAHPRLGLVAAAILVGDEERADPVNRKLLESPLGWADDLPGPRVMGFLACACVVRRTAFTQAGGFDPLLFFGGEETLLAQDLAARGWEL